MSAEANPALKLISEARDCSVKQARQFCSKVRRYCREEEPTDSEILGALRELGSQDVSTSYHEVATEIEERGSGSSGTPGKKNEGDAEILRFEDAPQNHAFINWINLNQNSGFVLNLRGDDEDPILHVAGCSTLKPDPKKEKVATNSAKLCSTNRGALRQKGRNLAEGRLQWCEHCDI